jgi:methionine-rich copper-binding protein CopC
MNLVTRLFFIIFLLSCGEVSLDSTQALTEKTSVAINTIFTGKEITNFSAQISNCSLNEDIIIDQELLPVELAIDNLSCVLKVISITIADKVYDYSKDYSNADWSENSIHQLYTVDKSEQITLSVVKAIPSILTSDFTIIINLKSPATDNTQDTTEDPTTDNTQNTTEDPATDNTQETSNPLLQTSAPEDEDTSVSLSQEITLNFDKEIKLGSGNITIFSGNISEPLEFVKFATTNTQNLVVSDKSLLIKPGISFTSLTQYHLQIDAHAITDTFDKKFSGIALGELSFTTADVNAPRLNIITQVSTPSSDASPSFIISSNEPGTISYEGNCSSAVTAYNEENTQKTITLNTLAEGTYTDCKVILTDNSGNSSNLTLNNFTIDLSGPTIQSSSPVHDSSGVAVGSTITLTFNENIQADSGNISIFSGTVESPVSYLSFTSSDSKVVINNNTLTITPGQNFTSFTNYHLQIDNSALSDTLGNSFLGLSIGNLSFTTADINPPVISFVSQISSPTSDTTPSFIITSDEAASISYSGSCSSSDTLYSSGDSQKTITFNSLAEGTYSDCSLTLTDSSGNSSNLALNSFTVNTETVVYSAIEGAGTTSIINSWQKVNAGAKLLTAVSLYLKNTNSTNNYNVYLELYDTDDDPSSANPWNKFSGTPLLQSSTVVLPKNTNSSTELKFTIDEESLSINTDYYLVIKTSGSSGISIYMYSDESTNGGAGNNFGQLNHQVYARDP